MLPDLSTTDSRRPVARTALVAVIGAMAVAALGGTGTELGAWYQSLVQPSWKPPDTWFGPAWTLIFGLTAWAGTRVWVRADGPVARRRILGAFGLNGALNVLWSWIFFRWRSPDWALAEVVLLWLSIVLLIRVSARIDRFAAVLLAPYLGWVTFAATINVAVVRLNPTA